MSKHLIGKNFYKVQSGLTGCTHNPLFSDYSIGRYQPLGNHFEMPRGDNIRAWS